MDGLEYIEEQKFTIAFIRQFSDTVSTRSILKKVSKILFLLDSINVFGKGAFFCVSRCRISLSTKDEKLT